METIAGHVPGEYDSKINNLDTLLTNLEFSINDNTDKNMSLYYAKEFIFHYILSDKILNIDQRKNYLYKFNDLIKKDSIEEKFYYSLSNYDFYPEAFNLYNYEDFRNKPTELLGFLSLYLNLAIELGDMNSSHVHSRDLAFSYYTLVKDKKVASLNLAEVVEDSLFKYNSLFETELPSEIN